MIEITCGIYKEPRVMVEDISALGLRSAAKTDIFCTSQFGYIEIQLSYLIARLQIRASGLFRAQSDVCKCNQLLRCL